MREVNIENYLIKRVKKLKGKSLKINSSSMAGLPDRLVLLPGGILKFVELKAPGKKPRPTQLVAHRMLESLGFKVYVIDSKLQVDEFLKEVVV